MPNNILVTISGLFGGGDCVSETGTKDEQANQSRLWGGTGQSEPTVGRNRPIRVHCGEEQTDQSPLWGGTDQSRVHCGDEQANQSHLWGGTDQSESTMGRNRPIRVHYGEERANQKSTVGRNRPIRVHCGEERANQSPLWGGTDQSESNAGRNGPAEADWGYLMRCKERN